MKNSILRWLGQAFFRVPWFRAHWIFTAQKTRDEIRHGHMDRNSGEKIHNMEIDVSKEERHAFSLDDESPHFATFLDKIAEKKDAWKAP